MSNLILLVQTPSDLAQLNATIPALRGMNLSALWVFYNLAAVVDAKQLYEGIDKRIAALDAEIKRASAREDFASAATYKEQRDAAVLEKATAAKDAVRNMPKEQLEAAVTKAFTTFWEAKLAPSIDISASPEHYETKDWVQMLHARLGDWPSAVLPHGGFIVGWPGQFVGGKEIALPPATPTRNEVLNAQHAPALTPVARVAPAAAKPAKERKERVIDTPRFKELAAMHVDRVFEEAKKVGIPNPMGTKLSIVHSIIKREKEIAADAVLA